MAVQAHCTGSCGEWWLQSYECVYQQNNDVPLHLDGLLFDKATVVLLLWPYYSLLLVLFALTLTQVIMKNALQCHTETSRRRNLALLFSPKDRGTTTATIEDTHIILCSNNKNITLLLHLNFCFFSIFPQFCWF